MSGPSLWQLEKGERPQADSVEMAKFEMQ